MVRSVIELYLSKYLDAGPADGPLESCGQVTPTRRFPMAKNPVTTKDASRIQSHADRTGTNQDFKARIQAQAAKNSDDTKDGNSGDSKGK